MNVEFYLIIFGNFTEFKRQKKCWQIKLDTRKFNIKKINFFRTLKLSFSEALLHNENENNKTFVSDKLKITYNL